MLGNRIRNGLLLILLAVTSLVSCGGGGSDSGSQTQNGEVVLTLTDAEGDFVTYTVDVLSIKLTRADGTQVETLPNTTRVDFAQYTDLSEFLTAASVPPGVYVKGSVVLDYSTADIQVEDATGAAVPVTQILDTSGNPISTLEVAINIEDRGSLPIVPGVPKNLALDFDLQSSHTVSLGDPVSITVDPLFVVDIDPAAPKVHRIRGPLRDVNVADSYFDLYIRPFFHRIRVADRAFGGLRVNTNDSTIYEIDGVGYSGADGLSVLATMPAFSAVIAVGELRFSPLRFEATEVYAGSSVPGGDMDVVRGTVTGRTADDKIIVQGATLFRTDGVVVFNDHVTVQLDASTTVAKQLSTGSYSIDDISVGQRISVFGTITNDSAADLQMSAANGFARMRLSSVSGDVVALPDASNNLSLHLLSINGRNPAIYDFTGTGTSGNDADPLNYEIDHGTLSLDGIALADDVSVRGFPTPFGSAPADFTAQSVIKR